MYCLLKAEIGKKVGNMTYVPPKEDINYTLKRLFLCAAEVELLTVMSKEGLGVPLSYLSL